MRYMPVPSRAAFFVSIISHLSLFEVAGIRTFSCISEYLYLRIGRSDSLV